MKLKYEMVPREQQALCSKRVQRLMLYFSHWALAYPLGKVFRGSSR